MLLGAVRKYIEAECIQLRTRSIMSYIYTAVLWVSDTPRFSAAVENLNVAQTKPACQQQQQQWRWCTCWVHCCCPCILQHAHALLDGYSSRQRQRAVARKRAVAPYLSGPPRCVLGLALSGKLYTATLYVCTAVHTSSDESRP